LEHTQTQPPLVTRPQPAPAPPAGVPGSVSSVVLLALLFAAFSPALLALSEVWDTVDYYAHGYLVIPVAAAMAWSRRGLVGPLRERDGRGLGLLILALLGFAVGLLAGLLLLQGLMLPLALAGLAWWRLGAAGLRRLAFPIAYLVFMVPLPAQWLTPLVTRLQMLVTQGGIAVLHALGVPALREGNVIVVPEGSLFVAEACSGITSIVTLLPVAALLVFLVPLRSYAAVALMLAVVPVAMFWNLARVLLTVAAVREIGVDRATTGWLHDSAGMLTFTLGCLSLLLLSSRLTRPGSGSPPGTARM